jgi:5'-AMP-activated protein kinase regulatory beta subunit
MAKLHCYLGGGKKKGTYSYDFMVDGKVCLAPDQPIVNSRNSVAVIPSESFTRLSSANNDEEGWSQEVPDLSENAVPVSPQKAPARKSKNQGPVELPAHLERALLNSQPVADDPAMLPLPHHVMLNHLYSRPSLYNTFILGLTVRHRENFVTVVLYKPTEQASTTPSTAVVN